jgi:hypothetical protein
MYELKLYDIRNFKFCRQETQYIKVLIFFVQEALKTPDPRKEEEGVGREEVGGKGKMKRVW